MVRCAETAEDLVQETFLRAFKSLEKFDVSRPFAPWVCRIAVNTVREHFRKCGREVMVVPGSDLTLEADGSSRVEQVDDILFWDGLLERLPVWARILLLLKHGLNLNYEEMAQLLDEPIGSVKGNLFRARSALKDCYLASFPAAQSQESEQTPDE
jgi:RNA polymerase sigma-70 factor (ECF subfamily)